ncbi:MAG: aldo/keto reductase [Clostridia bacterium]|nr:aldo/keto reductase [Clostridia bacterium]
MEKTVKPVLGTMTFGESVFMPDAQAFVDAFLERGYTDFDTAYVYNGGQSERLLGQALKNKTEYCVATKVNPRISGRLDGEAAYTQLNGSLARLEMEKVGIFYLHFPDPATPVVSVLEACAALHREGKFGELGLSNFPAWMVSDVWHLCDRNGWVKPTVYEGIYNPLTRNAERELDAALTHFGMRFYAYNPLAGGLLSGRYASFEEAPGDGRFTHRPNYQDRYWKRSFFEAVALLKDACAKEGIPLVEAVYRWLIRHSMLKGARGDRVIVGASKLRHLEDNLSAFGKGALPAPLLEAFGRAWALCRADSPEYFTLYTGKK